MNKLQHRFRVPLKLAFASFWLGGSLLTETSLAQAVSGAGPSSVAISSNKPNVKAYKEANLLYIDNASGIGLLDVGTEDGMKAGLRTCVVGQNSRLGPCGLLIAPSSRTSQVKFLQAPQAASKVYIFFPKPESATGPSRAIISIVYGYQHTQNKAIQVPVYDANEQLDSGTSPWRNDNLNHDNYGSYGLSLQANFGSEVVEVRSTLLYHSIIPREAMIDLPRVFDSADAYGLVTYQLRSMSHQWEVLGSWVLPVGRFSLGAGVSWDQTTMKSRFYLVEDTASSRQLLSSALLDHTELSAHLVVGYQLDFGRWILGWNLELKPIPLSHSTAKNTSLESAGKNLSGFEGSERAFSDGFQFQPRPSQLEFLGSIGWRL